MMEHNEKNIHEQNSRYQLNSYIMAPNSFPMSHNDEEIAT